MVGRFALFSVAIAAIGCGRVNFDPLGGGGGGGADGAIGDGAGPDACVQSAWSTPVELSATINSGATNWEPALRRDGQMLVYGQDTAVSSLYAAAGNPVDGYASPAMILTSVNSNAGPAWTPGGDQLFFVSDRVTVNSFRLYTSNFNGAGFMNPVEVTELAGQEIDGPTISSTGLEMFYNDGSGNGATMRRAIRGSASDPWQDLGAVDSLNSGTTDGWPTLADHDLTIYWESHRSNAGGSIYMATRAQIGADFTNPSQVPVLSDDTDAGDPEVSGDGKSIMFASTRDGGTPNIFVSTRACP